MTRKLGTRNKVHVPNLLTVIEELIKNVQMQGIRSSTE